MVADRNFPIRDMQDFLMENEMSFHTPLSKSLSKRGISIFEYAKKLCQKGTVVYERDCDGYIKGMVIGYTCDLPEDNGSYITLMVVAEKHQKQGVASKLLDEYLEFCKNKKISYVWANTLSFRIGPQKILKKAGFFETEGYDAEHKKFVCKLAI